MSRRAPFDDLSVVGECELVAHPPAGKLYANPANRSVRSTTDRLEKSKITPRADLRTGKYRRTIGCGQPKGRRTLSVVSRESEAGGVSDSVTMNSHGRHVMATRAYYLFTAHVISPWALRGTRLHGEALEIGAGVGAMAHHLLETTPGLRMVVTDFDAEMCSQASKALGDFGHRVAVEQVDANNLPFTDDRFDFVVSFLMLHHTGDWRQTVREALRVLRPGGRFLGFDVLAGAPLHHKARFPTLMRPGELDEFFTTLPVTDAFARPAFFKSLVRFNAKKQ